MTRNLPHLYHEQDGDEIVRAWTIQSMVDNELFRWQILQITDSDGNNERWKFGSFLTNNVEHTKLFQSIGLINWDVWGLVKLSILYVLQETHGRFFMTSDMYDVLIDETIVCKHATLTQIQTWVQYLPGCVIKNKQIIDSSGNVQYSFRMSKITEFANTLREKSYEELMAMDEAGNKTKSRFIKEIDGESYILTVHFEKYQTGFGKWEHLPNEIDVQIL